MQSADSGPVTRSRRFLLGESSEKESSNTGSGTSPATPNVDEKDTTMATTPPKNDEGIKTDSLPASPARITRNRRSISLSSSQQDSPSRNLRKRTVSPENKPVPVKNMTPTKKLKKNETNLLITFDSPKPRRGRLSLDGLGPALDTSNLRRSRRLSTELNVVQEDPIKEAEVDASPASQPAKGRRGKRLSVLPSQPSVPEESEEPIVVAKIIDLENADDNLQTITESSDELCRSENVDLMKKNPIVCVEKFKFKSNDTSEKDAVSDVNKSPVKNGSDTGYRLRKSSLNKSKDNVENLDISTNKSLNKDDTEVLNTSKKSTNLSQDNIELNSSIKSMNKSKDEIVDVLNTSKKTLNISKDIEHVAKRRSLNKSQDKIDELDSSVKLLNNDKNNIQKENIADLDINDKLDENEIDISKISLNMSKESVNEGKRRSLRMTPGRMSSASLSESKEEDNFNNSKCDKTCVSLNESSNSKVGRTSLSQEKKRNSISDSADASIILIDSNKDPSETLSDRTKLENMNVSGKSTSEHQSSMSKSLLEKSIEENLNSISSNKRKSLPREKGRKNSMNGSMNISQSDSKSSDENLNTSKKNTSLNTSKKTASEFFVEEKSESLRDKNTFMKDSILDNFNTSSEKENETTDGKKRKSISECSPKLSPTKSNSQTSFTSTPLVKNSLNDSSASDKKSKSRLSKIIEDKSVDAEEKKHSESTDSNFDSDSTEDNVKITYLDSEASEVGSAYESGDSMNESERMEIEENEVIERGVSLNSENTSSGEDSNDTYEKDSFVCSSDDEDEVMLSGTGDDLSSGAELSQSKESKKKYNDKEKERQKKASREMYEARHGVKHNNSGKNNFDSSSDDNEEEKEISLRDTSLIANLSNDPLRVSFTEDNDNSSDDEDVKKVKTNYEEELKRLGEESIAIDTKDSDSDNEVDLINGEELIVSQNNSLENNVNVNGKSKKKSKIQKGLNKSDIMKASTKKTESVLSKSLNLGSETINNPNSMQESMDRLLSLNKSLSKVFTSLINDVDKLKDTVYDGASIESNKTKTDIESSVLKGSEENTGEDVSMNEEEVNLVENETETSSKTSQLEKRKLNSEDYRVDDEQPKKIKISAQEESRKIGKLRNAHEIKRKNLTESKYKLSQQSKLIKKNKQTKDVISRILKAKDGNSIFDFNIRPKSPALKNKVTSTSRFVVEELNSAVKVKCTETAGKFSVLTKQERRLCKSSLGSTTNFAVASLKNHPKQMTRVDTVNGNEFVNFKNDILYGKNIRRETSNEMFKKQQKAFAKQKRRHVS